MLPHEVRTAFTQQDSGAGRGGAGQAKRGLFWFGVDGVPRYADRKN